MSEVHSTAILDGDIDLAEDVVIGPHCVLTGRITIGRGTRLLGNVYIQGPLTLGEDNLIYPFSCLGFAPQATSFPPDKDGLGVEIGHRNQFRESSTVHRAMTEDGPTRIGNDNYFMNGSHAGHDSQVGSHCIFASSAMLGGHAEIADKVIMGGNSAIHQFCRVGTGAMVSGLRGINRDLPPWFMLTADNRCGSVNLVGLRRSGVDRSVIDQVRWVFRIITRETNSVKGAMARMVERADDPTVRMYLDFLESATRGICNGRVQAAR